MFSIAGFVSILATIGTTRSPISERSSIRSSAARTNDCATRSTPRSSARARPSRSRSVTAGRPSRSAGTLTPWPERTMPPRRHSVRTDRPSMPTTSSSTAPSASRTRSPSRRSSARSAYVVGRARHRRPDRAAEARTAVPGRSGTDRDPSRRAAPWDPAGRRARPARDRPRPRRPDELDGALVVSGRAVREVHAEDRGARRDEARARTQACSSQVRACTRASSGRSARPGAHAAPPAAARRHPDAGGSDRVSGTRPPSSDSARSHPAAGMLVGNRDAAHLGEVDRPGTGNDPRPLVAAAAGGDPPTAGGIVRELVQRRGRLAVGASGEAEVREGVGRVGVASELGHEHVGPERPHGRRHAAAEGVEPLGVAGARRERDVHGRTRCIRTPRPPRRRPVPGKNPSDGANSWIETVSTLGSSQKIACGPSPWWTSTST